jgi:L-ornithine Nalpha-acyltransferase
MHDNPASCLAEKPAVRQLTVRLAASDADIAAVQRLRARVFFDEMGGGDASGDEALNQLDADIYDPLCDHLLVIDEGAAGDDRVVGTYRLLRESVAKASFGFYSSGEFDLGKIVSGPQRPAGELLELGRSCVLAPYRTSATIQLLWRGIADYIAQHRIGLLFGCASFPGTDPDCHAAALSWLHHNHLADPACRPSVLPGLGAVLERLPRGAYDDRQALMQLPPLVKGYLRIGARFGDGAYIDHAFNTVDVCVVMPVERISQRYAARFSIAA